MRIRHHGAYPETADLFQLIPHRRDLFVCPRVRPVRVYHKKELIAAVRYFALKLLEREGPLRVAADVENEPRPLIG